MTGADKKWKGRSMYQVRTALAEASKIGAAAYVVAQAMQQQADKKQQDAAAALVKELHSPYQDPLPEFAALKAEDIVFGGWECPESPIGTCIYDDAEDPMHDDCLFCHDPQERK